MRIPTAILVCLAFAGCSTYIAHREAEDRAEQHMATADSLAARENLEGATRQYLYVAEQYSHTGYYPRAVRKAAFLLAHPGNPLASDSAAIRWFRISLALPISTEEQEYARLCISLLDRVRQTRADVARQSALNDSLSAVGRRQSADQSRLQAELSVRNKRIQELEAELKRLREVDMRISRGKK